MKQRRQKETAGFTLIELLIVLAIIALIGGLLFPLASSGIERARVSKVRGELRQIEMALEMYHDDYKRYPPVRVSCNTDEREHWCELPRDLVELGYLPSDPRQGVSSAMEDPFNPGHTYKYAAPGPYYLNGQLQPDGFAVYVPADFPVCHAARGAYHDNSRSPLAWAVWSLGPRPSRDKALSSHAPLGSDTWYRGPGDNGVIARIKPRDSGAFNTP
jgi:prepilin-type N-terminal cleavage/methylation domain-containing protein